MEGENHCQNAQNIIIKESSIVQNPVQKTLESQNCITALSLALAVERELREIERGMDRELLE